MQFDAIVIGSGQSGTPLATALQSAGRKTALIERNHIGGCCVNEGCTPTKTMIASGRVAYSARRSVDYGVHTGEEITVDMSKVRQRKRDIVDSFRGGSEKRIANSGVTLYTGEASFTDDHTLDVKMRNGSKKTVKGDLIIIQTGERPAKPSLDGIDTIESVRVSDSTSIQESDNVPNHLIVSGGGYIGLEFGQLFRRLGAKVTIVQRGPQSLPREDTDIATAMQEILTQDGIDIKLHSEAVHVSPGSDTLTLDVKGPDGHTQGITGSHLLVAAGRVPNTDMLNLPSAGVETDKRGYIKVSPTLQTSVPHIYALGDVKGPPAFTHISYDDFRILRDNLIDSPSATSKTISDRIVPYCVYTDPQLGHVGSHEAEARAKFPDKLIKVAKMPMAYVARASETDESRGMMKAVVDGETGRISGFTCLGLEGGEIMTVVQMAMVGGLTYKDLQNAVFAHPTLAESSNNLWGFLE